MHVVVIAWVFFCLMLAITSPTLAGGISLFFLLAVLPLGLLGLALRSRSMSEEEINAGDKTDAGPDQ